MEIDEEDEEEEIKVRHMPTFTEHHYVPGLYKYSPEAF